MKPTITLSQALSDPELFGETFASPSFWTWRVVAKLIDGIALTEKREIKLFEQCTGRKYTRQARRAFRRLIILVGRRGGKDRFLSAVAVWRAALAADWRKHISAGEQAVVILLGADRRQAGILRRYCQGLLEIPRLKREVTRITNEVIEFRNGASLEIGTNDASLIRGRSAIAVLGSETCHWETSEASASSDEEVVASAEPSMAMCPDGGLLLLGSSVYRKRGYMYRMFKELHGNNDSEDICWFAPSRTMNPKLPQSIIDKAIAKDASKAGAEYLNLWRMDEAAFISRELIESCIDRGVRVRRYDPRHQYLACLDASSGVYDSFGCSIAHREGDSALQDCLTEVEAPFSTVQATTQIAETLKAYNIRVVLADDHAKSWLAAELAKHGISLQTRPTGADSSTFHLEALALFTSGRARLLDSVRLTNQYVSLTRRLRGDREIITHPTHGHDDLAVATSGSLFLASRSAGSLWRSDHFLIDGRAAEPPRNVLGLYAVLIGSDRDLGIAYFNVARTDMRKQTLYLVDVGLEQRSSQSLRDVQARLTALYEQTPSLRALVEMSVLRQVSLPELPGQVYCQNTVADELRQLGYAGARELDHLLASGDLALMAAPHIAAGEVKVSELVLSKPFGLGFLDGTPGRDDDVLKTAVFAGICAGYHGDRLIRPRVMA